MSIEASVYNKHLNLKLAAEELGIKWQTLYCRLKKQGVSIVGDKLKYGSDKDRLAANAEVEFLKIIPFAEDQNKTKFQSKFDFLIGNQKIDIKAATAKQGCKRFLSKRWAFSVKKQEFCADFIVCFAFTDDDEYRLFMIPGEFIRHYQTISISEKGKSKWLDYEITKSDMLEFFKELQIN